MREAASLRGEDAVIGVLGRMLLDRTPECPPLLHALEDEVHAKLLPPLHRALPAPHILLFAPPFLSPLDGEIVITGEASTQR